MNLPLLGLAAWVLWPATITIMVVTGSGTSTHTLIRPNGSSAYTGPVGTISAVDAGDGTLAVDIDVAGGSATCAADLSGPWLVEPGTTSVVLDSGAVLYVVETAHDVWRPDTGGVLILLGVYVGLGIDLLFWPIRMVMVAVRSLLLGDLAGGR